MKPAVRYAIDHAKRIAQALVRRSSPVVAGDLARSVPVSRQFGFDRGTPIDRHYIERFLDRHRADIRGDVMEIGGATYARKYGADVRSIAVLHATAGNPEATLVADLTKRETLPAASVDCLICTQTLNFIFDLPAAVAGIHHVLRPGGIVLATTTGISAISRYDMARWGDYWRFTDASMRRLFETGFQAEVTTFGNLPASMAFLDGLAVEDLPERSVLDQVDEDYQLVIALRARKLG